MIFSRMAVVSLKVMADIPYEIKFDPVFNFDKAPVTGNQTFTVRLLSENDDLMYKGCV